MRSDHVNVVAYRRIKTINSTFQTLALHVKDLKMVAAAYDKFLQATFWCFGTVGCLREEVTQESSTVKLRLQLIIFNIIKIEKSIIHGKENYFRHPVTDRQSVKKKKKIVNQNLYLKHDEGY